MRIGSLCSGYGGLDLGAQAVLGGSVAWHVEYDPNASRILHHHWPHVPNLGDLTTIDWSTVEPVDVLTAGYPCQPFSHAGKRKGSADVRHLWPHIIRAVRHLRPRLVLLENVAGHLTLGFGDVLADLAEAGFDAEWVVLRAADVGAPHGRARLFIAAHAEGDSGRVWHGDDVRAGRGTGRHEPAAGGGHAAPDTRDREQQVHQGHDGIDGERAQGRRGPVVPAGTGRDGSDLGWPVARPHAAEGKPPTSDHGAATDTRGERHGGGQDGAGVGRVDGEDEGEARERERSRAVAGDRGGTAATDTDVLGHERAGDARERRSGPADRGIPAPHTAGDGRDEGRPEPARLVGGSDAALCGEPTPADADGSSGHGREPDPFGRPLRRTAAAGPGEDIRWGAYGPAIERWEHVLGRPAPRPVQPSPRGGRDQLSPRFVEWLMGLPDGHVTDVPGLTRNAMLKALGNGVVPAQAAAAFRLLLPALLLVAAA